MIRLAGAVLAMLVSLAPTSVEPKWKLVWSDEFNGAAQSTPAAADWNFIKGWGPKDNHEIEWYCAPKGNDGPCDAKDSNAYEDGEGHLVLKAIHAGQRWSSARMETEGKHAFLYGRVEARLKMEPGAGFWPAFWMLGDDIETKPWPECGEIDIMEWVQSYGAGTTSSTVHGPGYSGGEGIGSRYAFPGGGRIDDGQFHTYGVTWSKDRMEFYRDDPAKPYFVMTPASLPAGKKWVYDHPFFVILNFAVGEAGFSGSVNATTPASGKMVVDYVRVYQQE